MYRRCPLDCRDEVEDDEQLEVSVYLGTYDIAAGSCTMQQEELNAYSPISLSPTIKQDGIQYTTCFARAHKLKIRLQAFARTGGNRVRLG